MHACLHTITTSAVVRRAFYVHVNINKSIRFSFRASSLSVVPLRGHDIVSEFDFSNLSAQLLHNPSSPPTLLSLPRLPRGVRHRDSNCSWLGRSPHHDISPKTSGRSHSPSITFSESSLSLSQRKAKVRFFNFQWHKCNGNVFICMLWICSISSFSASVMLVYSIFVKWQVLSADEAHI